VPEVSIYLRMYYTARVSIRFTLCSKARCGVAIDLLGPPSRQSIEYFHEAHGGFTIWLDPFGIFDPQVVVKIQVWGGPVDQLWHRERAPCPSEGIPKCRMHALAACTTPGQLEYNVALALHQNG